MISVPLLVALGNTPTVVPDATVTTWPAAMPGLEPVPVRPPDVLVNVKEPVPAEVSSSRLEPFVITTAAPVSLPRCLKTEPPTLNAPRLDTVAPLLLTKPHSAVRLPPARTATVPLFRNPLLLLAPPPGWQPP